MAVSGADSGRINRVFTTTFDRYAPSIINEIARNDAIVGMFGLGKAIKVVTGGQRAKAVLDKSENANFDFRDARATIATDLQDTRQDLSYAWATLDGAVVLNEIEEAMNAGSAQIYPLAESEMENAKNTLIRKIADALRATSPGATSPESIVTIIPDTAVASQSTSTGELSRASNSFWRSQYSNTAMDLSSSAGLEALIAFMLDSCSKGTSKIDQPNFGLTTGTLFAALAAQNEAVRRFGSDADVAKMGFQTINVMGANIIADPSMASGDLRLINTNFCDIQVLRTPGMKDIGDKPQSMPISIKPFQDAYNSLNKAAIIYSTFALTCRSLQRQGIATNCS